MKVLLDQGAPAPLRKALLRHEVKTAFECGWDELENGALLSAAEAAGFDVFITTDQNIRYQQNLAQRQIAIIVLSTTNWPRMKPHASLVANAVDRIAPSELVEVTFP
jgi:hypothetical protein